jgi:hypothetical protein
LWQEAQVGAANAWGWWHEPQSVCFAGMPTTALACALWQPAQRLAAWGLPWAGWQPAQVCFEPFIASASAWWQPRQLGAAAALWGLWHCSQGPLWGEPAFQAAAVVACWPWQPLQLARASAAAPWGRWHERQAPWAWSKALTSKETWQARQSLVAAIGEPCSRWQPSQAPVWAARPSLTSA